MGLLWVCYGFVMGLLAQEKIYFFFLDIEGTSFYAVLIWILYPPQFNSQMIWADAVSFINSSLNKSEAFLLCSPLHTP